MSETWGMLSVQVARCRKRAFSRHWTTSAGSSCVICMLVEPAEASWLRGICCSMVAGGVGTGRGGVWGGGDGWMVGFGVGRLVSGRCRCCVDVWR